MSTERDSKSIKHTHTPIQANTPDLPQADPALAIEPSVVQPSMLMQPEQLRRLHEPQQHAAIRQMQQTHGNQQMQRQVSGNQQAQQPPIGLYALLVRAARHYQQQMQRKANKSSSSSAQPKTKEERMAYVVKRLVEKYGYPVNGAAGLVGNLYAESGLLANRVEGSTEAAPMKAKDAKDKVAEFTPEEVMDRIYKKQGPKLPGIGLAQWTSAARREGLFKHEYEGKVLGAEILNSLDAQIDYLVKELESSYSNVNKVLKNASTSVEDASDEVLFNFERPGAVLEKVQTAKGKTVTRTKKRDDATVKGIREKRSNLGKEALKAYNGSK